MKKLLSLVLVLVSIFSCFACAPEQETPQTTPNKILINSFEKERDFNLLKVLGTLGKVTFNKDSAYVKSGNGSAKITVVHDPYRDGAPKLYQSLRNEFELTDYTNFDDMGFVTLSVYNAQDTVERFGIEPVFEFANAAYGMSFGNVKWFDLEPNSWTQINYSVEREYIPLDGDNKHGVEGINFRFDRPKEVDKVFYVDDINCLKTNIPVQEITKTLVQDEVCSFDYKWQAEFFQKQDWLPEQIQPEYTLDSTNTANGTGYSLKVTAPGGIEGRNSYPGLIFCPDQIGMVNWDLYEADDEFVFDVYVPETNPLPYIHLLMYAETLQQNYCNKIVYLKSNQWNEVRFKVSELEQMNISDDVNFNKTGYISMTFLEAVEDRVFWIDNMRMETK